YGSTVGLTVKNAGSLLFNPDAKDTADLYYQSTLGVRAADPSTLIDWTTGQIIPQSRFDCGIVPNTKTRLATANGGDANDYNTVVGNLRLASRPIESKDSIEYKFDLSFVDLLPQNYNNSVVRMPNPKLDQDNFLEPGSSPFLDYMETVDFIQTTQGITVDNSSNGLLSKNYVSRRTGVE
ncbi:MAG TPA: hypothetical protein VFM18_24330, partial [Methanosarcina sp.]|nr:hypothetical protein [Methanosarcina sp.]